MGAKCPVYIVLKDARIRRTLVETLRAEQYHPTPFASGSDFLEALDHLPAGVAILDLHLADNWVDVLTQLLWTRKDVPVVITAENANIQTVVQVIKVGADDFLEQPFSKRMLLEVIDQASDLLASREDLQRQRARADSLLKKLTRRELEVLRLIQSNKSNEAAANELHLSVRTIETYRLRIMRKCGVTKFSDAISVVATALDGRSKL
ncbi:DNA-binding response regulator [Sphingobium lactosutens]|uniref:response regulator transcription factor n=1 Tax=Sphingobium lactosutens TaxID=522773 RepID=UPI0015C1BE7A|nr:response regulator [Sphingobium lactosutens]NWK99098.1 DNA-binding response regulator [Sphingobium lactosutens]